MTEFRVEQSGWYRTRDGSDAEVVINRDGRVFIVVGYIVGNPDRQCWQINGYFGTVGDSPYDLVEYLGKERPKQPKKFKVKARLYNNGEIVVDDDNACFVNVLRIVETREIEWEVPDNG